VKLSDVVSHAGLAVYAEVALVLFAIAFVIMAFDLTRKRKHPYLVHQSMLPFDDGPIANSDGEKS
jgi:hypothetical protein